MMMMTMTMPAGSLTHAKAGGGGRRNPSIIDEIRHFINLEK
jgi:hypothetical protein